MALAHPQGEPMRRLDITIRDVDNYSRYRLSVAKNDPITVNGDLRTLRRLLKLAVTWGRLKAGEVRRGSNAISVALPSACATPRLSPVRFLGV
jgi:hypothetical protein